MFEDLNEQENKQKFVSCNDPCYIPGYTGYCPMLKFRFGKSYGESTRQILGEIHQKLLLNKPLKYRAGDTSELEEMRRQNAAAALPKRDVYEALPLYDRAPHYMAGYTGFVPGLNFRYGKSYGRSADDCMEDFAERQKEIRKADYTKTFTRSRSVPKMESIHTRDEIRRDLQSNNKRFREINKYKENTISPEFPPIAGYTGHIPRIKGSEASLSQRYQCAARNGLELIRREREARDALLKADRQIKNVLRNHHKKYSYYNWG